MKSLPTFPSCAYAQHEKSEGKDFFWGEVDLSVAAHNVRRLEPFRTF